MSELSERIYALLLRLYPARFRRAYGEEALQLIRDRMRDERGFAARARLWLDLLGDLAVSLPREYRSGPRAVAVAVAPAQGAGMPGFHSLEEEALSSRSLLSGTLAALLVYGSLLVLLGQGRAMPGTGVLVRDEAGSATMRHMRTPDITLSFSQKRPVSGAVATIAVTVGSLGGPTATGGVRFYDGVTVLTTRDLDEGAVTIRVRLPRQEKHLLRATYLGDNVYSSVSSTLPRE